MNFAFGMLVGFVLGCAFTLWFDRQRSSACTKGGLHYWQRYDENTLLYWQGYEGNTNTRFCTKCGRNEEEVLYD